MFFEEIDSNVRNWTIRVGIHQHEELGPKYEKLLEEVGELGRALIEMDEDKAEDAIGDIMVVLHTIATPLQRTLTSCYAAAYEQIKDRKGKMVNGIFVKDEPNCDESKIIKPKCSECFDNGTVEYYHDCGDHFGGGTAPGSDQMGDMGDIYRERREYSQAKRADNRHKSTQLLIDEGIDFQYKNNGAHLIILEEGVPVIDFWPGTGKWIERQTQFKGRGIRNLIKHLRS